MKILNRDDVLKMSRARHEVEPHVCGGWVVSYSCHGTRTYAKVGRFNDIEMARAWAHLHGLGVIDDEV